MESYIDLKKYINNAITEEEEVTEAAYSVLKGEKCEAEICQGSENGHSDDDY